MKKAANFIRRISKKDEVIIIFHNDADGICSATILNRLIARRTGKKALLISQPMPAESNIIDKIKTTVPTKIIITDLAIDQQSALLKKIAGYAQTLVIDHHIITNSVENSKITYFNPRQKNSKAYQSASYLCYYICSEIEKMDKELWLALVGAIADYNLEDSQELIKEGRKKFKFTETSRTIFSDIGNYVFSTKATKKLTPEEMADAFFDAEGPEKIGQTEKGKKMVESNQIIQGEIASITSEAQRKMETQGNVMFAEINSKYNIRSPICTIISESHKDKLVIVYEKNGNKIRCSARNQNKNLNAGKIIEKVAKGIRGASGGGHEAAAAAVLPETRWKEFKEKLVDLANK